jgi:hypothetical protein
MPAQIDAVGIDRFLAGEIKGGGQDVVDFAQKGLLGAWVVVASAQRGDVDCGLPVGFRTALTGRLAFRRIQRIAAA